MQEIKVTLEEWQTIITMIANNVTWVQANPILTYMSKIAQRGNAKPLGLDDPENISHSRPS